MVKGAIRVVRNAQYESQSRTLAVSEKPSVGIPIVPIVEVVNRVDGVSSLQFDGERYIHGKIREFTLRSASHSARQATLPHQNASTSMGSDRHDNDNFVTIAQGIDNKALHEMGFPSIQKGLREFVLAHMLCEAVDVPRFIVNRENASSTLNGMKSTNQSKYASGSTGFSKMDHLHHVESLSTSKIGSHWKISKSFQSVGSHDSLQMLVCLLISCGAFKSSSKGVGGGLDHYRVKMSDGAFSKFRSSDSFIKVGQIHQISSALGTLSHPFALKDVSGFGTAPIWYQQSMATGPPVVSILAGYQK